jgi:type VI protein secretion system component VasF
MSFQTMASIPSSRTATAPKGRPTASRSAAQQRRSDAMITLQWAMVALAIVALFVVLIIVSDGQGSVPTRIHGR